MSAIKSCEVQNVANKKPDMAAPTLVLTLESDFDADKARKRRSSRTAGLSSKSHAYPNALLFRTIPEEKMSVYDWQVIIQPRIKQHANSDAPMSPDSSGSTSFINAFSPRSPIFERSTMSPQPDPRPSALRRGSNATYTSLMSVKTSLSVQTRERAQTSTLISPSPSLRSKSSNISSQASSIGRPRDWQNILPIQQMPIDLPSPVSTVGFEEGGTFGWTSAQGRSSALSQHTRGSNSVSTAVSTAGTPPAPRETILERAFQMRLIPGSERVQEDDKLSSIARFEALMREADERRAARTKKLETSEPSSLKESNSQSSGWDLQEDSSEESDPERVRGRGSSSRDDVVMEDADEHDALARSIHQMSTPAQRALEYIAGRMPMTSPPPSRSGRTTPHAQTGGTSSGRRLQSPASPPPAKSARFVAGTPPTDPITRSRTAPPSKTKAKERPKSMFYAPTSGSNSSRHGKEHKHKKSDASSHMSKHTVDSSSGGTSGSAEKEQRRDSLLSNKRLSLTQQRLSSSSSLLLVQTNTHTSAASSAHGGLNSHFSHDMERSSRRSTRENSRTSSFVSDEDEEDFSFNDSFGDEHGGVMHRGLSQSRLSGMIMSSGGGGSGGMESFGGVLVKPNGLAFGGEGGFL
jgi:hypothetical protein